MTDDDMIVLNPGNTYPVDTLYAWLSVEKSGNEGIFAARLPTGWTPMVFGKLSTAEKAEPLVRQALRHVPDKTVRLVKFNRGEELKALP